MIRQIILFALIFVASCTSGPIPIKDLINFRSNFDEMDVFVVGRLCADVTTVYLSTSANCDDFESGRRIVLSLSETQFRFVETINNGSTVHVRGKFNDPGKDALVPNSGIVPGAYINVVEITEDGIKN